MFWAENSSRTTRFPWACQHKKISLTFPFLTALFFASHSNGITNSFALQKLFTLSEPDNKLENIWKKQYKKETPAEKDRATYNFNCTHQTTSMHPVTGTFLLSSKYHPQLSVSQSQGPNGTAPVTARTVKDKKLGVCIPTENSTSLIQRTAY